MKQQQNMLYKQLAVVYEKMAAAYNNCAAEAGLSCSGCTTNCCTSYFQHHTYIEWAYLWQGMYSLAPQQRQYFMQKAKAYIAEANQSLSIGALPHVMCPLNEDGLCALYQYRLMICRLHGTRNSFLLPNGQQRLFPGCTVFASRFAQHPSESIPTLDRTPFYQQLAQLEVALLKTSKKPLQKVNLSIAEMLAEGAPRFA